MKFFGLDILKHENHKLESFYGNQIHEQSKGNRTYVDAGTAEGFSNRKSDDK